MQAAASHARAGIFAVLIGATSMLALPAVSAAPPAEMFSGSTKNWIAPALPAVVSITTAKFVTDPERGGSLRRAGEFGSGFIIDPTGVIVTNKHVIQGASDVVVILQDQSRLHARPIYIGEAIDLALLKVDARTPLPVLQFGDSDQVQVGDVVAAVGNPLQLGGSASAGIVSGLNRDIMSSAYDNFIQTDAAINHGNSGGPLIDGHGQVIGVNTAIYSPTATSGSIGIGFAAPSNDVKFVVDEILRYGKIQAGWLGLDAQTVTPPIAAGLGAPDLRGSIIAHIQPKSPAMTAGLRIGDVLLKVGDQRPLDSRALARATAETKPDSTVPLSVWREGKELTILAKLGEWQDHPMRGSAAAMAQAGGGSGQAKMIPEDTRNLGVRFARVSDDVRHKLKLAPEQKGAVVQDVALNSPAADVGIRAGDLVRRVQMSQVDGPEDALRLIKEARAHKLPYVLLLVQRTDGFHWLPVAGVPGED